MPGEPSEEIRRLPDSEHTPRGFGRLVPSGVKSWLNRRRTTSSVIATQVMQNQGSPELTTGDPSSGSTGHELSIDHAGRSPIHPDIEEGARYILDEKLVESVRTGNTAGIKLGIRNLAKAFEQAQRAAGARFELTPEGQKEIPRRLQEILNAHLNQGLVRIYEMTAFGVANGWEQSVTGEPKRIEEVFRIAQQCGIELQYTPSLEAFSRGENAMVGVITTSEQALAHLQEVIDRHLLKGIKGILETIGHQVSVGELKQLPGYEEKIEKWLRIMEDRSWRVVDHPTPYPLEGESSPNGLVPREVNRAEIRTLIDSAVKENLAKGAKHIVKMVASVVSSGMSHPLSNWGSPENIALYVETAKKYRLLRNSHALPSTPSDRERYIDEQELQEGVKKAIRDNLPAGLSQLVNGYRYWIAKGEARMIQYSEGVFKEYTALAGQYEVAVDMNRFRGNMQSSLTVDALRQGVQSRIDSVRDALRTADYLKVGVESRIAEEFKALVQERGFGDQVDFSELDKYLAETATQTPKLTG